MTTISANPAKCSEFCQRLERTAKTLNQMCIKDTPTPMTSKAQCSSGCPSVSLTDIQCSEEKNDRRKGGGRYVILPSIGNQAGWNIQSGFAEIFQSPRMQRHRQPGQCFFQGHHLGCTMDSTKEWQVFIDSFGNVIDRLFIKIGPYGKKVRLGDRIDITGLVGIGFCGDNIASP